MSDIVKEPPHYTMWKIEPITFIMDNHLPFHTGNIIKYAMRAGYKLYDGEDEIGQYWIRLEKNNS